MNEETLYRKLVKDALNQGGVLDLDLRNPEHYEFILNSLFQDNALNSGRLKGEKPSALLEFIQSEHNKPCLEQKNEQIKIVNSQNYAVGAKDTAYVEVPVVKKQNHVSQKLKSQTNEEYEISKVVASYTKMQAGVRVNASLYNLETEEQVGNCFHTQENTQNVSAPMYGDFGALVGKEVNHYEASATLVSIGEDDRKNTVMSAKLYANNQFAVSAKTDYITKFEVLDPAIKVPDPKYSQIRVSYKRDSQMGYFDYSYDNQPINDAIKLILPVKFRVKVNRDICSIVGLDEDLGYRLYFQHPNGGLVEYYYYMGDDTKRSIEITENNSEMVVTFDKDWQTLLAFDNLKNAVSTNLDIYGQFNVCVEDQLGKFPISISFKSNGESFDLLNVSVPQIYMQWGCLGKDTMISMADGSRRRISELQIGESVQNVNYKPCQIMDIITGDEQEIYQIHTKSGKEIKLTDTHSICIQQNGESQWICVCDLKERQKIVMEHGVEEVSFIDVIPYHDKVYNLVFNQETPIYGNEFLVGDYMMQQRIHPEKEQVEFTEKTRKLADELCQLEK